MGAYMGTLTYALVGACDFNERHFSACADEGAFDRVVAVDAGYAHLQQLGCKPDVVLGDFDSLGYVPDCGQVLCFPEKKDKSDMELALEHVAGAGRARIVVYGALGGRLDHTVANVQLLARYAEAGYGITAVGQDYAARFLVGPETYELPHVDRGTVSVFALTPEATGVTERGLEYPLDDAVLTNRTTLGLSNELMGETASVSVQEGTLLVFHPLGTSGTTR